LITFSPSVVWQPTPQWRHVCWQLTCEISLVALMTFQHSSPSLPSPPPHHFSFNFPTCLKVLYITMLPCNSPPPSLKKRGIIKVKDVFCSSCGVHAMKSSTQTQFPGTILLWAWPCLVLIKCPQFLPQMSDGSYGVFVVLLLVVVAPKLQFNFTF